MSQHKQVSDKPGRYYFYCVTDGCSVATDYKNEAIDWLRVHANDFKEHIIALSDSMNPGDPQVVKIDARDSNRPRVQD